MAKRLVGSSATWLVGGRTKRKIDGVRLSGLICFITGPLEDDQTTQITVQKSVVNSIPDRIDIYLKCSVTQTVSLRDLNESTVMPVGPTGVILELVQCLRKGSMSLRLL